MILLGDALSGRKHPTRFIYLVPIGQWLAILNAIGIWSCPLSVQRKYQDLQQGLFNLYSVEWLCRRLGQLYSFDGAWFIRGQHQFSLWRLSISSNPGTNSPSALSSLSSLHTYQHVHSPFIDYVHGARLIFVEFFSRILRVVAALPTSGNRQTYVKNKKNNW